MSFSWEDGTGYYVPVAGPTGRRLSHCDRVLAALKPILEDAERQEGRAQHQVRHAGDAAAGMTLRGVEMDSMVAAFLIDASRMQYGIDSLALRRC